MTDGRKNLDEFVESVVGETLPDFESLRAVQSVLLRKKVTRKLQGAGIACSLTALVVGAFLFFGSSVFRAGNNSVNASQFVEVIENRPISSGLIVEPVCGVQIVENRSYCAVIDTYQNPELIFEEEEFLAFLFELGGGVVDSDRRIYYWKTGEALESSG